MRDMVGFLLDPSVTVHTRSKQDLDVADDIQFWKHHVTSLLFHLSNPDIHRFTPNVSVRHLGSDILNINPLINTSKGSWITLLVPFVEA